MLVKNKLFSLAILIVILITQNVFAQEQSANELREKNIGWLFTEFQGDKPGVVVTVMKQGEIVFNKAYGLSNVQTKEKMTIEKQFNLAAISKSFTSLAILQLAEKNKIKLDNSLKDIFKDFPDYGKEIKVSNLLYHTSGLKNYDPESVKTNQDVYLFLKNQNELEFETGTKMLYSNSDYTLLAYIIEKVSGKSYKDYLMKYVFKRLSMVNTFISDKVAGNNVATPYLKENGAYVFEKKVNGVFGENGIYTNTTDFAKWDKALYTDKLLGCENLQHIFTLQKLEKGEANNFYGFGWVLMERNGVKYYWHGGSESGYSNLVFHLPEYQLTVLLLSNRNDSSDFLKIAIDVAKQFEKELKL